MNKAYPVRTNLTKYLRALPSIYKLYITATYPQHEQVLPSINKPYRVFTSLAENHRNLPLANMNKYNRVLTNLTEYL
eukprot:6197849-Pleurochrysis_carterae.AAC.1